MATERRSAELSRLGKRRTIPRGSVEGLASVIIPSYQSKWCVAEAIDSALNQTYKPIEVVVIDDGSTDGTAEFLDSRFGTSIKVISQINRGLAGARNTGLENSSGEYIQFLDADDLLEPPKLEKQIALFRSRPEVSVVGSFYTETGFEENDHNRIVRETMERMGVKDLLVQNFIGPVHCPLVRRGAVAALGGFDESFHNYCADWELWLSIAVRGFIFARIDEPLAIYRRHDSSLTREYVIPNMAGDLKVVERGYEYARLLGTVKDWDIYGALAIRYKRLTRGYARSGNRVTSFYNFMLGLYYAIRAGKINEALNCARALSG